MTVNPDGSKYVPGTYAQRRPSARQMADRYILEWSARRREPVPAGSPVRHPAVCLSREIGAGALELADLLAPRLGYRVADREIIEYIAGNAELSRKTVEYFDERYSGRTTDLLSLLFGEKSFVMSDYARHLFSAIFSLADSGPTIFVGRGAHLVLEREAVLAVRIICSKSLRVARLARLLQVEPELAARELASADKRQRDFFKKMFNLRTASPHEFDLVVNLDHLPELSEVADIVCQAYRCKFGQPPHA